MLKRILSDFIFFNDTATTEIYTLSLHDALPIWQGGAFRGEGGAVQAHDGICPGLDGVVAHGRSPQPWCQNGVPSTGVLGWAADCSAMAPARWAAWPAFTASAKAPAMATGSSDRATAVFSSTAS